MADLCSKIPVFGKKSESDRQRENRLKSRDPNPIFKLWKAKGKNKSEQQNLVAVAHRTRSKKHKKKSNGIRRDKFSVHSTLNPTPPANADWPIQKPENSPQIHQIRWMEMVFLPCDATTRINQTRGGVREMGVMACGVLVLLLGPQQHNTVWMERQWAMEGEGMRVNDDRLLVLAIDEEDLGSEEWVQVLVVWWKLSSEKTTTKSHRKQAAAAARKKWVGGGVVGRGNGKRQHSTKTRAHMGMGETWEWGAKIFQTNGEISFSFFF